MKRKGKDRTEEKRTGCNRSTEIGEEQKRREEGRAEKGRAGLVT